ncbi:MAG: amidohydrolase family protein [Armatimonadota bacterium]
MTSRPRHVVDFHTHAFPEKVAARAITTLTEAYQVEAHGEATVPGLLRAMDEAGVDVSVIAPVATRPDQVRSINDWAAALQTDRIVCFGALHPALTDAAAEVERMVSLGIKGVKLQPNFQGFEPDDQRLWPLYEAAAGRLIVLFHSGQEIKAVERIHSRPESLARVHKAFPRLMMVVAHMGGYRVWDEVRRHLVGEEVYFDTSYCDERDLSAADMRDLIGAHGAHRVLFGTDYPWGEVSRDLDRLCAMGLGEAELEAIAWRNAAELLGLRLGEDSGG